MESLQGSQHGQVCALEKSLWRQCGEWIGWIRLEVGSQSAMAASSKHSEILGEILLTIFYDTYRENIFMDL